MANMPNSHHFQTMTADRVSAASQPPALREKQPNSPDYGSGQTTPEYSPAPQDAWDSTSNTKSIKLYIAEEQQILRDAYQSFFKPRPDIEVVGAPSDTAGNSLVGAVSALKPDVMLLGFKSLQPSTIEKLQMIRESCPNVAMVLLSAQYDVNGIKALRQFSKGAAVGCAYLLKYNIDTMEQLVQVIRSVSEGRVILDPVIMEGLIASAESKSSLLKELTPRELEVLGWMAKGYRNTTIAEVLCLDPKTIERHINNIYSKLGDCPESKHARVRAITLYMKAMGLLATDDEATDD